MTSRPQVTTAIAALAAATALACTARERRTPDDTLVMLIESAPRTADPRSTVSSMDQKLSRLVCPGLVVMDSPDSEPVLALAERIEPIDPLTWEVTVRADVRFSDGTPVTADDVAWT